MILIICNGPHENITTIPTLWINVRSIATTFICYLKVIIETTYIMSVIIWLINTILFILFKAVLTLSNSDIISDVKVIVTIWVKES